MLANGNSFGTNPALGAIAAGLKPPATTAPWMCPVVVWRGR
jgi:hypothetical protein